MPVGPLCVPPPLKGLSVLQLLLPLCAAAAGSATHVVPVLTAQQQICTNSLKIKLSYIVCQQTLRTHDQLSTTLQKQKKPSTFD